MGETYYNMASHIEVSMSARTLVRGHRKLRTQLDQTKQVRGDQVPMDHHKVAPDEIHGGYHTGIKRKESKKKSV